MKENDYLKSQISNIKRQQESFDREEAYRDESYRRENREVRKFRENKEKIEINGKKDYLERKDSPEEGYRREVGKRIPSKDPRADDRSPEESFNRRKPVVKVEPIVDLEPKKKEYMPVRTIVNTSNNVTEALTWNTHKRNERPPAANDNLQLKLNDLVADQGRLKSEIERLSETRGQNAAKRRGDLELELSICESNINSLTAKIRKMNWLSNS
jgi:hypothetical protein